MFVGLYIGFCVVLKMPYNGLQICDGRDFYYIFSFGELIFFNLKTVCGARNPAYCKCAVGSWFVSQSFNAAFNLSHVSLVKIVLYSVSLPLMYSTIYSALSFESGCVLIHVKYFVVSSSVSESL